MLFDCSMPEPLKQNSDLDGPSCDNKIEANCTPTVRLEEDHEEPESDENHDMYVLEEVVLVESRAEVHHIRAWVNSVTERSATSVKNQNHKLREKHR
jgi:hypothetical protein